VRLRLDAKIPGMAVLNTDGRWIIRFDRPRQRIDGFGVCEAFRQAGNIRALPDSVRTEVLDLLFSPLHGAGFTIIRNIVGDGGTWGDRLDGPTATIEPAEGKWNWTGDEDQIWITREAITRGCEKVLASVWSPPAWMKTNGSVTNGGFLRDDKYQAFAVYLSQYVREYKTRHGIDVFAISPTNEPNMRAPYSSCTWTGPQLATFIAEYLGPVFESDNVHVKIVMPETEYFGMAQSSFFEPALQNPKSALRIDIIAQHGYGGKIEKLRGVREAGKAIWLTEISDPRKDKNDPSIRDGIRWAMSVHDYLTIAEVNAYCYFWGASIYNGGPISLLGIVNNQAGIVRNKRLFAIGNYSRFIRPGSHRVEVTPGEADNISLSAFTNRSAKQIVIVAINPEETSRKLCLQIEEASIGVFYCFRTSVTEDLAPGPAAQVTGGTLSTVLPGLSVTSLVGMIDESSCLTETPMRWGNE
jgi:glucuronoarabinoxylan endo-1,4-beta-xylanase